MGEVSRQITWIKEGWKQQTGQKRKRSREGSEIIKKRTQKEGKMYQEMDENNWRSVDDTTLN